MEFVLKAVCLLISIGRGGKTIDKHITETSGYLCQRYCPVTYCEQIGCLILDSVNTSHTELKIIACT